MKPGLVSYNAAKDWNLPAVLHNCAAAGIQAFEARTTHAHGIEPSLSSEQRRDVKQQFAGAGVVLWGLGSVCEFHSDQPEIVQANIEECKRFVQLADDVGARGVKVRPNGLRKDVSTEDTLKQIADALRVCGDFGAQHNVEVWLEVHGAETQKPALMRQIMDFCGHPNVGVCWNSMGTDIADGSIQSSFESLRPFIKSCHINDLWGPYPYSELFSLLQSSGYDRFALCEVNTPVPAEQGEDFLTRYREKVQELQK